jgi:hypothetical protein
VVFNSGNGTYAFGIVGRVKDFAKASEKKDYEHYSKDKNSRSIYCFLGFCCDDKDFINAIPIVTPQKCFELFEEYVIPKWEDLGVDTIIAEEKNVKLNIHDCVPLRSNPLNQVLNQRNTGVFLSSPNNDAQVFNSCLSVIKENKSISLCTNVEFTTHQDFEKLLTKFNIISSSENVMSRMSDNNMYFTRMNIDNSSESSAECSVGDVGESKEINRNNNDVNGINKSSVNELNKTNVNMHSNEHESTSAQDLCSLYDYFAERNIIVSEISIKLNSSKQDGNFDIHRAINDYFSRSKTRIKTKNFSLNKEGDNNWECDLKLEFIREGFN